MSNKSVSSKEAADELVKNIRRKTARKYSVRNKGRSSVFVDMCAAACLISQRS